jgi:hypothetical protein
MHEDIGGKIRHQRKKAKLTQAKLGSLAFNVSESIGQTRIKNLELHYVKKIYDHEIKAICKALKISAEKLLTGPSIVVKPKRPLDGLHIPQSVIDENPKLYNYLKICLLAIEIDNLSLMLKTVDSAKAFLEEKLGINAINQKLTSNGKFRKL